MQRSAAQHHPKPMRYLPGLALFAFIISVPPVAQGSMSGHMLCSDSPALSGCDKPTDRTPPLFDYSPVRENAEAEQIGFELLGASGPVILCDALYERIERDLRLIRATFPALAEIGHNPKWEPSALLLRAVSGMPTMDSYEALNAFYQASAKEVASTAMLLVTFPRRVNIPALATAYAALDEIDSAEPNTNLGRATFWEPEPTASDPSRWRWRVTHGFGDCPAGCIFRDVIEVDVTDKGEVTLVSASCVSRLPYSFRAQQQLAPLCRAYEQRR